MLRSNDVLARTGGEEFTILLPDTALAGGAQTAERIREAIESLETPFEGEPIRLTVSAGVAQFDPSLGDWENMMRRADAALYEAKEHGRNAISAAAETYLSKPLLPSKEQGNFLLVN
jgi:diguanylate cyclase